MNAFAQGPSQPDDLPRESILTRHSAQAALRSSSVGKEWRQKADIPRHNQFG
jgi:hypothetical protein